MDRTGPLTAKRLRTPRAAAIAGILFSGLLIAAMLLFLSAVPKDALDQGAWLSFGLERVVLAINLMPFAGIAFLWFIGVVRDRLADAEDRLFATVFLVLLCHKSSRGACRAQDGQRSSCCVMARAISSEGWRLNPGRGVAFFRLPRGV